MLTGCIIILAFEFVPKTQSHIYRFHRAESYVVHSVQDSVPDVLYNPPKTNTLLPLLFSLSIYNIILYFFTKLPEKVLQRRQLKCQINLFSDI